MRQFINEDDPHRHSDADSDGDDDGGDEVPVFDLEFIGGMDGLGGLVDLERESDEELEGPSEAEEEEESGGDVGSENDDDDDDANEDDDDEKEDADKADGEASTSADGNKSATKRAKNDSSDSDDDDDNGDNADDAAAGPSSKRSMLKRLAKRLKAAPKGGDDSDADSDDSFDMDPSKFADSDGDGSGSEDDDDDADSDDKDAEENRTALIDDDEDDVIKAIIAATKTERSHPPDLSFEDFIVDISFHPVEDVIAVGTMGGDIVLTRYSNEENKQLASLECHMKAIRDLEFSLDGLTLLSTSKDRSVVLSDVATAQMRRVYEGAHEVPVYRMAVLDEHTFATGDEDGCVKLWDQRVKGTTPIFSLKECDDYITGILTNSAGRLLLTTSGDGYLTAFNIGARKLYVQSEPYEEELTCMGLFRSEQKLVVGSSKGRFYTFDWDAFGLHSNMFPGPKSPLSLMVPVTDRIAVTGGEEGVVRAMHMLPGRNLGVVGQHPLGVEAMDISNNGELIASSSHENDIKFWNIKYFEDMTELRFNEKQHKRKEERHNLPSSKQGNAGDFFADLA